MTMRVKAAQWGNSVAVRLPRRVVEALGVTPGQELAMEIKEGRVELTSPRPNPVTIDWILSEMDRLGPEAEPATVDWGPDVGSEIIDDDWSPG